MDTVAGEVERTVESRVCNEQMGCFVSIQIRGRGLTGSVGSGSGGRWWG